ncbi:DUF742 domain-containing protein [Streptomyces sp. NPDC059582]|uniref:DUF742 domain-containing protein n=1 Tax=Streptomyces sp. NPDC059582 TaxID=3346875 RepID=UPI0036C5679F
MHDEGPDELELTSALVPLFVITQGRGLPADHEFEHTTLVIAHADTSAAARTLSPEARRVMDLIADGYLSVAEVSGHTHLPLGIVRILLAEMAEKDLIIVRNPPERAERHDRELLVAVLDGLRTHLGA